MKDVKANSIFLSSTEQFLIFFYLYQKVLFILFKYVFDYSIFVFPTTQHFFIHHFIYAILPILKYKMK